MIGRPAAARRDESFPKRERLRSRTEYQRCYREGRRRHGDLMILYAAANELEHPRLGITVSRKVGNSVVRHRVKRRLREIYRRWSERTNLPAMDFMVHLKPAAGRADFPTLATELTRLLATWLPPATAAS
jgi:ribonuclease P protein component